MLASSIFICQCRETQILTHYQVQKLPEGIVPKTFTSPIVTGFSRSPAWMMTYLPVIGFPGMFIPALQYFVILTLSRVYVQVHPFFGRSDIFVKELVSLSFVKLKYSTGYQRLKELLVNPIKDDDT